MTERVLLVLYAREGSENWSLDMSDARTYSPRAINGIISQAVRHVRKVIDETVYDIVIDPGEGYANMKIRTRYRHLYTVSLLEEIIAKVHSGSIRFRTIEFEPKPRRKK